ncbi:hypothetical protein V8F33_014030 [Rhypophila sp. PSN 637]
MTRNKQRVYIAISPKTGGSCSEGHGEESHYNWALLILPRIENPSGPGRRIEYKSSARGIANTAITGVPPREVQAKVLLGKVRDRNRLESRLAKVPSAAGRDSYAWAKAAGQDLLFQPNALKASAAVTLLRGGSGPPGPQGKVKVKTGSMWPWRKWKTVPREENVDLT